MGVGREGVDSRCEGEPREEGGLVWRERVRGVHDGGLVAVSGGGDIRGAVLEERLYQFIRKGVKR